MDDGHIGAAILSVFEKIEFILVRIGGEKSLRPLYTKVALHILLHRLHILLQSFKMYLKDSNKFIFEQIIMGIKKR